MEHVGIDLGSRRSAVCRVDEQGTIVRELTVKTMEIASFLERLPGGSRIVLESCAESRKVALMGRDAGHEVRVVPTSLVRALGVGARKIKTDKRDAATLALTSFRLGDELPHVHIRSDRAAALQDLVSTRASLVSTRTTMINFVRAQMRKALLPKPKSTPKTLTRVLREEMDVVPPTIASHLEVIDKLNEEIDALEELLKDQAKAEDTSRLRQIPGVGPIVSVAFVAAVDDPKRFANGGKLASYVGLSPGENTTGGKVRRTGIVAAGQPLLRKLLIQAAHVILWSCKTRGPMAVWAHDLAARSGTKVAVCALARRLAVVMWAMLRDGSRYEPNKTRSRHPRPAELRRDAVVAELADVLQEGATA